MKNLRRTFIIFFCTAVIAACGGSGSSGSGGENVEPIAAPYTGTYEFDSLVISSDNGSIDSEDCVQFRAEFSYSPERSIGKVQCGVAADESRYYYIDSAGSDEWVSCDEVEFTVTGDYTAEIVYSCTDFLNDVYQAAGSITKTGNSFTVLPDTEYWEDPDGPR
ncbi:MAG: hypothetical protein AB7E48_02165 [Deferribacterales bacterium]